MKCLDETFNAIIENQITSKIEMFHIDILFKKTWQQLSMNFHKVTMDLSRTDLDLYDIDKKKILREVDKSGCIHQQMYSSYYVIDSEWNELDSNMKFIKQRASYCNY